MRDLNREAWFLYQVTSIEHFERCAQACQEFAEVFDQLMTKHDVHGYANLDYWVREYYSAAEEIRRRIELVKLGDYMPMISELNAAKANYRGFSEQPDGWMTNEERKEWMAMFERLSALCGYANQAMRNNEWAGLYWVNREKHKHEQELVDRDDGMEAVYTEQAINYLHENGLLSKPDHYPQYRIDKTRSCRAGETCPWTGVWIPEQALTEGLEKFNLAFAMVGRPMQPAYRIVAWVRSTTHDYADDPETREILGEDNDPIYYPETKAEDALWYPVVQLESETAAEARPDHGRLRGLPNELVPKTGWWWSPAFTGTNALRHFNQGEHFPSTETTGYGGVFWYYDADRQSKE